MSEVESVATMLAKMDGKLDLSAERVTTVQKAIDRVESTISDNRNSMEAWLQRHTDAENPHPNQERWLREIYADLGKRVVALEADKISRKAILGLLAFLATACIALAGVVVALVQ